MTTTTDQKIADQGNTLFDEMLKLDSHQTGDEAVEAIVAEDESVAPKNEQAQTVEQYGTLAPEARRALVTLLKQGVVLAADKRLVFDAVCKYEVDIRHQLANMYLELLLDHRVEVALIVQQQEDPDDIDNKDSFIKLIQKRSLTLFDSLVILVLRKHFQNRENLGETRTLIALDQIAEQLVPFLPLTNNESLDKKRLNSTIEKLKDHKIISRVRGDDERLEITPVIRYVIDSNFLAQLEQEYLKLLESDSDERSSQKLKNTKESDSSLASKHVDNADD